MVTSLLTIVGVLVVMFIISWLLALIALVTVPLSVIVATKIGKRAQPSFVDQWRTTGQLNGHIEEMYTGHSLVKLFGRRHEAEAVFRQHNESLYQSSFKAQFVSGLIQPAMTLIGNINYVFVAVVGGLQVASGQLSLGAVQAFIQYSRQFSQPISQVASMANMLQSGVASAERVFALLDATEQEPDAADARPLPVVRGEVAFEDVSFSYFPDQPLIEGLSLAVAPGETVAIVGPTGAGKTTLVNLLMRFYEVDKGRITLDGVDIASLRREELRSKTGMVLQDTWLFGGTIAENIAYGAPGATHEEIVAAAQASHVDHFVRTLPDGYDTLLDEEGASVSAGERQLITIARAFLAEPAILILDEATSSVDTRTEVLIQRAMAALRAWSDELCHRAPALDDPRCRSHLGDGVGVDRRARYARGAARCGRCLCAPLTRRSSRARSPGKGSSGPPVGEAGPMSAGSLTGCGAVHLASVTKRGPRVKDCCSHRGTDDRLFLVSALVVPVHAAGSNSSGPKMNPRGGGE